MKISLLFIITITYYRTIPFLSNYVTEKLHQVTKHGLGHGESKNSKLLETDQETFTIKMRYFPLYRATLPLILHTYPYIYMLYSQRLFLLFVFLITIYRAPPSFLRRRKVQQRRFGHGESKNPVPPCPLDQQGGAQSREALSLSLFGESLAGVTAGRPPLCPPLQP